MTRAWDMAGIMSNSSFGRIPSGTTANRPASPAVGDQYYNGTLGVLEIYTASGWLPATGANDFNVALTGSHTSTTFTKEYFAGAYTINSALADTSYDIYVYSTDGSLAGYTKSPSLVATGNFNKIVVLGGSSGDLLSFSYKTTFTTSTESSQVTAGAYITSISASSMPNVGDSITVTGGNFATNAAVHFTGTGYSSTAAKTVVRNSATSLTVTRPDNFPVSGNPYTLTVTNPSINNQPTGSNAHKITLTAGSAPVWTTTSIPSVNLNGSYSVNLQATDADGGSSISYSLSSGLLPTGLTLNSSGLISGTATVSAVNNFVIRATDSGGNYSDKSLSIAVLSGGTLTSDSTYYYRTFTSNGNFVTGSIPIDMLQIAGGGGGGNGNDGGGQGGGGAGGVLLTSANIDSGTYSITVGAGGAGATGGSSGNSQSGTNTSLGLYTQAVGGGYGNSTTGGSVNNYGGSGGSGGGGGGAASNAQAGAGGTAVSGQGNIGGSGGNTASGAGYKGGGGGGAGSRGQNASEASTYVSSAGGAGTNSYSSWITAISSAMTGISGWSTATTGGYIGGGGGGSGIWSGWQNAITGGAAGSGGGGRGGDVSSVSNSTGQNGFSGSLNTGGGGGAGAYNSTTGGAGGSGLLVVRYLKSSVAG